MPEKAHHCSCKPPRLSGGDWHPEDFEFHEAVLRHLKGIAKAYEEMLRAKKARQS